MSRQKFNRRYFTSYTGVQLPLRLVNELDAQGVDKRIAYFAGYYDDMARLIIIEKIVYGEIEFSHHYEYDEDGTLVKAIMIEGDELPRTLVFDSAGDVRETACLT